MNRTFRLLRPALTSGFRPIPPRIPPAPLATSLQWRRRFAQSTAKPPTADDGRPLENSPHDYKHSTARSATEEIGYVTRDVAQMISGKSRLPAMMGAMEISSHSHAGSVRDDFIGITKNLFKEVPRPTMLFGLAGTLPYLGTAIGTVFLAREAARASQGLSNLTGLSTGDALSSLHILEHVQITYGAIILSFLGALHWGMEFSKLGGEHGYARLAVGTLPVMFAWPTTFLTHGIALAVQWIGFTGMWFIDQRASTNGWTTSWYATYRFYLSIIVGFSIVGTFAGTGYFGAGAGAVTDIDTHRMHHSTERVSSMKRLDRVKEKNYPPKEYARAGKATGLVSGDIMVEENDDSYLRLRNLSKEEPSEEEEEQEQEEAEAKKQEDKQKASEYQDKRDEFQMDIAPGRMKDTAKDRTGKNANVAGGSEERPDEQKQSEQMGAGAVGKRTELGTEQDEEFKKKQEEEHGDSSTGPDEQQKARGKEAAREKVGEVGK